MERILIVDDENRDRKGIRHLIEKYNLPFDVCEAESGEAALQLLKEQKIDILLTDIRMPFMTGIDLAQQVRTLYPHIKTVIFSAYADFAYAQHAIRIGVDRYLLKPIDVNQFFETMNELREKNEDERQSNTVLNFLRLLSEHVTEELRDFFENEALFPIALCNFYLLLADSRLRIFDTDSRIEEKLKETLGMPFAFINLNEYQSLLLLGEGSFDVREPAEKVRGLLAETDRNITVAVSKKIADIDGVYSAYNQVEQALDAKFFGQRGTVVFAEPTAKSDDGLEEKIDLLIEEIKTCAEQKDSGGIKMRIRELFSLIQKNQSISSLYVKFLCSLIINYLIGGKSKTYLPEAQDYLFQIYKIDDIGQIQSLLLKLADSRYQADDSAGYGKRMVHHAIEIIHSEYHKEIGLEYVADRLGVSANYLSHVFKQATGEGFLKYVTSYRMNQAKRLLKNETVTVAEVAVKVGYISNSYFCSIFRRYTGQSPAQYRENQK